MGRIMTRVPSPDASPSLERRLQYGSPASPNFSANYASKEPASQNRTKALTKREYNNPLRSKCVRDLLPAGLPFCGAKLHQVSRQRPLAAGRPGAVLGAALSKRHRFLDEICLKVGKALKLEPFQQTYRASKRELLLEFSRRFCLRAVSFPGLSKPL